jgi:hypothetical protein
MAGSLSSRVKGKGGKTIALAALGSLAGITFITVLLGLLVFAKKKDPNSLVGKWEGRTALEFKRGGELVVGGSKGDWQRINGEKVLMNVPVKGTEGGPAFAVVGTFILNKAVLSYSVEGDDLVLRSFGDEVRLRRN